MTLEIRKYNQTGSYKKMDRAIVYIAILLALGGFKSEAQGVPFTDYGYQLEECRDTRAFGIQCKAFAISRSIATFAESENFDPAMFLVWNEMPSNTNLGEMLEPFHFYKTSNEPGPKITYQVDLCRDVVDDKVTCMGSTVPTTIADIQGGRASDDDFRRWNELPPNLPPDYPVRPFHVFVVDIKEPS
jgi:hypothetical protein